MGGYIIIIGAIVLAAIGAFWIINVPVVQAPDGQACTQEAKLCPDGSYVGRTGPACEFAACPVQTTTTTTTSTTTTTVYNSGVRGTVLAGPTCPVSTPTDPDCMDKPFATSIAVRRAGSSAVIATANSNASGTFQFSLAPGSYILAASGGLVGKGCTDVSVTVTSGQYATAAISCDTGIR